MVEPEWFTRGHRSPANYGRAWQGLYDITPSLSVRGRFADQREDVHTRALAVAADYHPYVELNRTLVWRVGGLARSGMTYSKSVAFDPASASDIVLGSLDVGGGGWVSAFKDLGRTRVGGGAIFQGTKSHVPTALVGDGLDYLVGLAYRAGILRFSGGYRNVTAENLTAHAVFLRGNFDW